MILDEIVAATRNRVMALKEENDMESYRLRAIRRAEKENDRKCDPFEERLRRPGVNLICEVKKASPSKGVMVKEFPYLTIAKEYEEAGAACISVLTEPVYFQGKNEYLEQIKEVVNIPVLRKDFILDEIQIYESKLIGADAVLLITRILTKGQLEEYLAICRKLHLAALVEAHGEDEVRIAVRAGARIIGVNNRNLEDFTVDFNTSIRLRSIAGDQVVFVAESGVKTSEDLRALQQANVNGVLIGETLMCSGNRVATFQKLTSKLSV